MTVTDHPSHVDGDDGFAEYCARGLDRALALGNRSPIRFTGDGRLDPAIAEAYWRHGFYVFEDVIGPDELDELRAEADALLDGAPYPTAESELDRHGRPALGLGMARNPWTMAAPLSDPVGGTAALDGRHPVKMHEPAPAAGAPPQVPYLVFGCLELMPSFLRVYGHPDLLRVAESINGPDFTPFNEVLFVKEPGLGPSVAWHQDGRTHWDSPDLDAGTHGFNFQVQLHGSTPGNGVWVVPGSHTQGRIDIVGLVAANCGSDRLPDAVPLVCEPGDAFITNRQTLHGSFPNTSADRRVTVNFGFHRYRSVIGQTGVFDASGGGNVFDAEYVRARSECIPVAIDARAQRFGAEDRYCYQPFAGLEDGLRYDEHTRRTVLHDYNLRDLGI